jgi:hypothetical protein
MLRTMRNITKPIDASSSSPMSRDPRLHALGATLRHLQIDELPTLWNVLRGEMSIVGPRPLLPAQASRLDVCASQTLFAVKPGITGSWKVSGLPASSFNARVALESAYVARWSPLLDLRIIAQTIPLDVRIFLRMISLVLGIVFLPAVSIDRPTLPSPAISAAQRYGMRARTDVKSSARIGKPAVANIVNVLGQRRGSIDATSARVVARRSQPPGRSLYWAADAAIVAVALIIGIELITKEAFVSGTLITLLVLTAATLFATGRLLKST